MQHTYDSVFFDWGGVIADDSGDTFLSDLVKEIGATDEQVADMLKKYWSGFVRGKISETEFWDALRNEYGLVIDDSIAEKFKKWPGLDVNQDVLSLVDEIRAKGYKTAVLSNIIQPCYDLLAESGLYSHFDEVIASCTLGYAKPEVEIYEHALRTLNISAATSIFIDDRQWNLDKADELGFTTLLATNPEQIIRDLKNLLLLG